jgi:SET domain-containing protein
MQHENLIFVFLIIILIVILNTNCDTINNYIKVKKSPINGNGVFAMKNFSINEIIEVAPLLKDHEDNMKGKINDYLFTISKEETEKGYYALALGYASLYNHSDNNNANYKVDGNNVIIRAIKPIKKGEEIFVNYSESWWSSREGRIEKL